MNAEQYDKWKNDPLTVLFHKYLTDYRQDLMERWANGALQEPESTMAMARCQMAHDIVTLDDDSISQFYRQTKGSEHVPEDQATGG